MEGRFPMEKLPFMLRRIVQDTLDSLVSLADMSPERIEIIQEYMAYAVETTYAETTTDQNGNKRRFSNRRYVRLLAETLQECSETCTDPLISLELKLTAEEISLRAMTDHQYARYRNKYEI